VQGSKDFNLMRKKRVAVHRPPHCRQYHRIGMAFRTALDQLMERVNPRKNTTTEVRDAASPQRCAVRLVPYPPSFGEISEELPEGRIQ
jgi:hypothetical protein